MEKLTPHQIDLLQYFADGGYTEICISVCSQLGETNFPNKRPVKFSKTVLYSLLRRGFLMESTEQTIYGIRWQRVVISNRGAKYLKELEVVREAV